MEVAIAIPRVVQIRFAPLRLGVADPEAMLKRPFEIATAHALYRQILGPADALLTGATQLIVVPDGALQSLPPGVLVTECQATSWTLPYGAIGGQLKPNGAI